jgi:glycosyltransferase involved in cell wall biosynthesis
MKKVSVILTTCNSETTIQRTLDSIMNQAGINKLFEIELLVIDDCSKDRTREILIKNKITFFSTLENSGGPNKGRNIGLKMMTGDYFCLIDHDDVWLPEKIIKQLPVAEIIPIVSTGYIVSNTLINKIFERKYNSNKNHIVFKRNETFLNKIKRKKPGQNLYLSTLMIDSRLKHILFEENFGMVDYDWLLRITENNETAEITECLVTRHVNGTNLSLNSGYRKKDYYYSLYFLENYQKDYPRECATAIKRLNGSRARYYYLHNDMKEARRFFIKSEFNFRQIAYILTSFIASRYIKSNFIVSG